MNKLYTIQLTALALALSTTSLSVMAQGEHELELTGWQTPLAAEFSRLDTSGNGLLKPNEASKGNAFNKRTFAQADVDHDGYIDQNEYIHFKTGEWPVVVQPNQAQSAPVQVEQNPNQLNPDMPTDMPDPNQSNAESNNRLSMTKELGSIDVAIQQAKVIVEQSASITAVSDDTVITHKAIATLLSTEDLEGMKINVETYLGEVLLSGEVGSQKDKMKAAYVVSKVDGVKSVKNELKVMS
ncbi:MAG TPA: BON domain-containing protein [Methylotenera sp.]|nr:BON domain-containing protein [Methylotenera sp.]